MPSLDWKKGICGICPAGCWVDVKVEGGRLTDIRADEDHQLGMICRRGQHAPSIVHSEHRIPHPLRRVGPKGTHEFERISWDDAYEIIVESMQRIRDESGPEAMSIYTGRGAFELSLCDVYQPKGVAVSSASSVLFPFGSPNTMGVGALCYTSFAMMAPHVTMGRMLINMFFDIENAETIVVWGANPATDSPPLDMYRLEAAAQRGARIVVIDPRRTETVERTGAEWIPVRPGTDGALALAMIEVLLDEELFDEGFAKNWCHGFDELRGYVQHFRPEQAAAITGVPAEKIRELARAIWHSAGCCPVMYTGLEYSNSGIQAMRAVFTLFALAGHLDVPGGIGLAMLDSHFPVNRSGHVEPPSDHPGVKDRFPLYHHYRGELHASVLVDAVLEGDPYRIRGLIVHGASILTSWPQTSVWRETLSKLDFMVTIDRQLTADSAYADVVLPATTMFEIDSYMTYGPIFRLREKVVEPVGEARNDYLIMAELANRLGYGDLYPQTEEEMIRTILDGSGYTLEDVKAAGGSVKIPTSVMQYRKWEKGGLRADGRPGFETPTGKFEISSSKLDDYGYEPLPKYVEPTEGPLASPHLGGEYPLVFNSGARTQVDFRSQHHGIRELLKDNPEPTVEMNPEDARERGIEPGDLVEIRSPRGVVCFRARVTEDIVRGAVECNMGGGTPVGPKAWRDSNVNELTDLENYDEISGFPVYKALLCEAVKVEAASEESRRVAAAPATGIRSRRAPRVVRPEPPPRRIYLDNNATTELAGPVRHAMDPFLNGSHGNPSSIHGLGREAKDAIEDARRSVARLVGAKPRRIVFTGSGSESINLALKGVAFARRERGNHIITSTVEHPAVMNSCRALASLGFDVTWLGVDGTGRIDPEALEAAIGPGTILISLMTANNEVGTVQPIRELAGIARDRGVLFHTDAVQACGKIPVDVAHFRVDLLSGSAHKFHGPKGVGFLYVRKDLELTPLVHGGSQESGLRAGTENVAGIVGAGKAAELAHRHAADSESLRALRDALEAGFRERIPGAVRNGHAEERLPNTVNLTLPGIRGESLVVALDQKGISLSSGSACKSGSPDPTHVLLAMGRSEDDAHRAVRLSLSRETTERDVRDTLAALDRVLREMETTVRFLPCK